MTRVATFSLDDEPGPAPAPVRQKRTKERAAPILARRQGGMLVGYADMDVELITRFDADAVLQVRVTQERHVGRHRLYWAILKIISQNLPSPVQPEALHKAIKLMLGVSVVVTLPHGDEIVPGSIAFDSMSEPEFRDFLDAFMALIGTRLLPGVDTEALLAQGREGIGPDLTPPKRNASSRTRRAACASEAA